MEPVDPDSVAYLIGELLVVVFFVAVGVGLVLWGRARRRATDRRKGHGQYAAASVALFLAVLSAAVVAFGPPQVPGRPDPDLTVEVARARENTLSVPLELTGTFHGTVQGQAMDVTFRIVRRGKERDATYRYSDGGEVRIRHVHGSSYLWFNRAGLRFYLHPSARQDLPQIYDYLDGRWLEITAGQSTPDIALLGNDQAFTAMVGSGAVTRRGEKTIKGVDCTLVEGPSNPLSCVDLARHRYRQIVVDEQGTTARFTFDYDDVDEIRTPRRHVPYSDVLTDDVEDAV